MANIKITSECPLYDGMPVTFKAPCDCTAVTGIKVCYGDTSQVFGFRDAHGNDLTGIGNLFAEGAYVKVILNTVDSYAYVQNADTNAYIEGALQRKVNPNLLDNGYFGNPVDQRGGYVVPPGTPYFADQNGNTLVGTLDTYTKVTQNPNMAGGGLITLGGTTYYTEWYRSVRGYTGAGYTIDRWKQIITNAAVILTDDGLQVVAATDGNASFQQIVCKAKPLAGKTITFALLGDGKADSYWTAITLNGDKSDTLKSVSTTNNGMIVITATVPTNVTEDTYIRVLSNTTGTCLYKAAKLELGTEQTLAHQDENGNWVLNEIPNYAEELAKCQRYQLVLDCSIAWVKVASAFASTTNYLRADISVPVTMRATPTITFEGGLAVRAVGSGQEVAVTSAGKECKGALPGSVAFVFSNIATALVQYESYGIEAYGGKIIFDANL